MPIAISPEHVDLADSVRSLVARVAPSEVLHEALEATAVTNPPTYWKAAAEQGLQGVHLAESVGGQGFGILELAIVLAEFGYGGKILPTFAFLDGRKPSRLAWLLKEKMLPAIYWDLMLKGHEWLARPERLPHKPGSHKAQAALANDITRGTR